MIFLFGYFLELKYFGFLLNFSPQKDKNVDHIIEDDVQLEKEDDVESVADILDDKRSVNKETTDDKFYFGNQKSAVGNLEERDSESGGRFKIEELSTEAEETTSKSSKSGKENVNEVSDETYVPPSTYSDVAAEKTVIENKENCCVEVN